MNQNQFEALEAAIRTDYANTAGIIIQRDGEICYEQYFHGCTAQDSVHVLSVTKSVLSALVGIAMDRGYIRGVDQAVLDFFPECVVPPEEEGLQAVTIGHLLTMTAPYRAEVEPYEAFFRSDDWVRAALDLVGGRLPDGRFQYSPIVGAHLLSGVLARAVGMPVLDFATEALFAPLGISARTEQFASEAEQMAFYQKPWHDGLWVADAQGVHTGSWGLTLTARELAKVGRLYLDGGQWQGQQVVPAEWVQKSTAAHAHSSGMGYGYLWWILDEGAPVYAAMGDGGNVIYVNAAKKLVVAMTGLFAPEVKDRIELIMEQVEPVVEG